MSRYTGPPMDIANMRSLGVTRVDVYCACATRTQWTSLPCPMTLRSPMSGCGSNAPSAAPGRQKPARIGPNTSTGQSIGVSEARLESTRAGPNWRRREVDDVDGEIGQGVDVERPLQRRSAKVRPPLLVARMMASTQDEILNHVTDQRPSRNPLPLSIRRSME
jgi:hypothetical protein